MNPNSSFGGFSFGGAAPSFGSPATSTANTGLSFGSPAGAAATTAASAAPSFGLGAPSAAPSFGSSFSFGQPAATAATSAAPLPAFGAATTNTALSSFGTAAQQNPSFGATQPAPSFGTATQAAPSFGSATQPAPSFGAATQPAPSFGAATQAAPSFGAATQAAPSFGAATQPATSFGAAPASTGFGAPTSTALPSFGAATQAAPSFGAATQPATSFGTAPAITGFAAPTSSALPAFGAATQAAPSFGAATQPATSFGTTPASTGFGAPTSTALPSFGTAAPATSLPSFGVGTSAAASVPATTNFGTSFTLGSALGPPAGLTSTTATTQSNAAPITSQLTFSQLEELINKYTLELEEQEKVFINQATQVNTWDNLLNNNSNKILELNGAVEKVKSDQKILEDELKFIEAQHTELEECITPLKTELDKVPHVDMEKAQTYLLAENLDTQLRQMSEDLKEVIEHLNEINKLQNPNDPIVQIGRILNAHMNSLQWIESSTSQINAKLEDINKMYDTLRRDTERSLRLTYCD